MPTVGKDRKINERKMNSIFLSFIFLSFAVQVNPASTGPTTTRSHVGGAMKSETPLCGALAVKTAFENRQFGR
jgi:hypothetical protein